MLTAQAHAKLNLALVVGPLRPDGKHEVVTVTEKLALVDTVSVGRATEPRVDGFAEDTIVGRALTDLAARVGGEPAFAVTIEKRIPVAAGLGGGSSDAATALRLANGLLDHPLTDAELHELAAEVGADVPLFLRRGPQLGTADGTTLTTIALPRDYHVVLWLPVGAAKASTAEVYRAFDESARDVGFDERRDALLDRLRVVDRSRDLARLPLNDLASSPHASAMSALGAFRADVSGAGPIVYGLFETDVAAADAAAALADRGRTWLTAVATDA